MHGKVILFFVVSMIVGLFTAFVLTVFWEWFVAPAFHVQALSFWVMYGLTMMVELLRSSSNDIEAELRHKTLAVMLDACVPADRREEVMEQLTEFAERTWYDLGWKLFGRVASNVVVLCLGFVVHLLAS